MKKFLIIFVAIALALGAIAITNSISSLNVKIEDYPHQHEYDEGTVTKEASCSSFGTLTRTCFCGQTVTEDILKVPHSLEEGVCTVCGASISENIISCTDLVDVNGDIHDTFLYNIQTTAECTWSDYCSFQEVAESGTYVNDLGYVVFSLDGYKGFLKNSEGAYVTGDQPMVGDYTFVFYGDSDATLINPSLLATYWVRFYDNGSQYAYPFLEGSTMILRKSLHGFGWVDNKTSYVYFAADRIVVNRDFNFTALVK